MARISRFGHWAVCMLVVFAFCSPVGATIHNFVVNLGQECVPCPAGGSPGFGSGTFVLDTTTGIASYNISFGGLSSPENNAHVHGAASDCGGPPPVTAGVIYGLPAGSPKIGNSPALSAARQAEMLASRHYVNIHSNTCGGGEIRGQIREVRACCLPGGNCAVLTQADCTGQGGVWQDPGSVCTTLQACCTPNDCLMLDPICCDDAGGVPQGDGTTCSFLQTCCLPNGSCVLADPLCCDDLGGESRPGECLGDGNSNGINDACENNYQNWVVADDFTFNPECPECRCDFDGDGLCQTFTDFQMLQSCFGPVLPGCEFADLNCDGVVDNIDANIWACLAGGNPPAVCCPTVIPPAPPSITELLWFGSYLDPAFDPKQTPSPRPIDGWTVALHRDIPPVPCPTGSDYDACGIIDTSPPCPRFIPDGSATPIPLATPACGVPGCIIPPPGYWRICARYLPNCTTPCSPTPGALCVLQFLPCETGISRPSELIAQWAFDSIDVPTFNASKTGCDQHAIYRYGPVNLDRGCLLHNCADPLELDPLNPWVFNPLPGAVYWLSIQAEVGHKIVRTPQACCLPTGCVVIPHADCLASGGIPQAGVVCTPTTCSPPGPAAPPLDCTEVYTGNYVTDEYWGWHTTPPGYHNIDDAYMGTVEMSCRGDWWYYWLNHLHWSQPQFYPCADDPTKSIDMAFYLFDHGVPIWAQPINPGPPPPFPPNPPIRKLPPIGGIDELVETVAMAQIEIFGFGMGTVQAQGPTLVRRSNPFPDPLGDYIDTEIIAMDLVGNTPFGPGMIVERFDQHSFGQSRMNPPQNFPLDSFFDVFVEIQLPGAPPGLQNLITQVPVHVDALGGIHEVPPSAADYQGPAGGPVQLYDRSNPGVPVGRLHFVSHRVSYRGGVDIHSDLDWANIPQECHCKGDMNVDSLLNGLDIQAFINCLLLPPPPPDLGCPCDCADMDDNGFVEFADVDPFVNQMLQVPKAVCPGPCAGFGGMVAQEPAAHQRPAR